MNITRTNDWDSFTALLFDPKRADLDALKIAIEALGPNFSEDHHTSLKAAIAFVQSPEAFPSFHVTRGEIKRRCKAVLKLADALKNQMVELDVVSLAGSNEPLVGSLGAEITTSFQSFSRLLPLVAELHQQESNSSGRYALKADATKKTFVDICTSVWMDCGHRIKSTRGGAFDNFLSAMIWAAFNDEGGVTEYDFRVARAYSRSRNARPPERAAA